MNELPTNMTTEQRKQLITQEAIDRVLPLIYQELDQLDAGEERLHAISAIRRAITDRYMGGSLAGVLCHVCGSQFAGMPIYRDHLVRGPKGNRCPKGTDDATTSSSSEK